tara:strand:+ start:3894 stop:5078 length:1185 start_codon:yes stop_codon:yes gene_type:complete
MVRVLFFLFSFSVAIALGSVAIADSVTPNDRIRNHLNVRDIAARDGARVIGKLRPGEKANYLGQEAHWFKVRLANGTEGYVHKSWSRLIPSAPLAGGQKLELHFMNVGQGDATLISCPNGQKILVDAGSLSGYSADDVRDYLLPLLTPVRKIDVLVITHPDQDHYNLLEDVLGGVPVDFIYRVGEEDDYHSSFWKWLDKQSATTKKLPSDYYDKTDAPNAKMECGAADIWIMAAGIKATASRKNAMSITLMMRYGDFEAVLTGDATFDTEKVILQRYSKDWLNADVLKIGHHGSSTTSTGDDWLEAIKPEIAIASAEYKSRFAHPRKSVIERLEPYTKEVAPHAMHIGSGRQPNYTYTDTENYTDGIYSTATNGNVIIRTDGSGYEITFGFSNP